MADEFMTGLPQVSGKDQLGDDNERLMNAMDFSRIQEILGDETPALIPGEVGRFRLTQSLRKTFGDNFRSNASAREAIKIFDQETNNAKEIIRMREILKNG